MSRPKRARIRLTREQAALLASLLAAKRDELAELRDEDPDAGQTANGGVSDRRAAIERMVDELRRMLDELRRTMHEQGWVYADDADPFER